jgi:ribosomal protein L7/L12
VAILEDCCTLVNHDLNVLARQQRQVDIVDPEFCVILVAAGPNRLAVILRVRQLLEVPLAKARELVDAGEVVLAQGGFFDRSLHDLREEFERLGATVLIR